MTVHVTTNGSSRYCVLCGRILYALAYECRSKERMSKMKNIVKNSEHDTTERPTNVCLRYFVYKTFLKWVLLFFDFCKPI